MVYKETEVLDMSFERVYLEKFPNATEEEILRAYTDYKEVMDMIIDGVWAGLNILGPMSFNYTTKNNHTVVIEVKAV